MEQKLKELITQDVWQLITQRLSQKDRSSARAVSRFFFKCFTPEWDHYSRDCRKIRAIAAGYHHSLLLTETGELFGCGSSRTGQLGLGDTKNQASWIKLRDKAPVRAIAAGGFHSLLLTATGELLVCGFNMNGQLGLGNTQLQASWIRISNETPCRAIAAGECHSLVLTETGELIGCGDNRFGQLGLGRRNNHANWIPLVDKTPISAIAAGGYHSLLLTEAGKIMGCGYNSDGQLGLGHTETQTRWVKLNPFPKSHSLSFDELIHQRHCAFQSVSLKIFLKQCDALFQRLHADDDERKQLALFSERKSSLQAQLTEPLPAPWDQVLKDLNVDEFILFYHRLREHFKLAPTMERPKVSICSVM